ncbi:MAG: polysaccharide deacetylase family protein [Armatimonadetes bacterium]|nr:polysaccharide deacetylase family protein [Armatimonadota bacterium]
MILAALLLGAVSQSAILTYHDFIPVRDSKSLWFDCTPAEFEKQLDWLTARGAHFVSVDQMAAHVVRHTALPAKSILITFADNYEGFYTYALPILRRRHIPSVMFVHTGYIGDTSHGRPKMTWAQLRELDKEGLVVIASQTVSHPEDLRKMTDEQMLREFTESKKALEQGLGHRIKYLAYPNGRFDHRVSRLAKQAGYSAAFTEELRPAEQALNSFEIPRYVHTKYQRAWRDLTSRRAR